jgi:hypothetical protein
MSCILIRYTHDKTLEMIQPLISSGVMALFVFSVLAPWWPSEESDWTENWYVSYSYLQSFGSIAPAVTKRAVLTDDDGRGVIT